MFVRVCYIIELDLEAQVLWIVCAGIIEIIDVIWIKAQVSDPAYGDGEVTVF